MLYKKGEQRYSKEVYTLGYYGSKKKWSAEFTALLDYCKNTYGTETLYVIFSGSGIVSSLAVNASYHKVYLNEARTLRSC